MIETRTSRTRILVGGKEIAVPESGQFHAPEQIELEFTNLRSDAAVTLRVSVTGTGGASVDDGSLSQPKTVAPGESLKLQFGSRSPIADVHLQWTKEPYNIRNRKRELRLTWIHPGEETIVPSRT